MNHRSLAFRLAVWYALLLSATFALVGAGMFYGLERYLRSSLGDSLRRRSAQIEQILVQTSADTTNAAIAEAIDTRIAPEFNNRFVRVTRAPAALVYRSGTPADRSFSPATVPPIMGAWLTQGMTRRTETLNHQWLMGSATPVETASGRYLIADPRVPERKNPACSRWSVLVSISPRAGTCLGRRRAGIYD